MFEILSENRLKRVNAYGVMFKQKQDLKTYKRGYTIIKINRN